MIAYASRTGTRRNLAALAAADWRLIVSAAGCWRTEGFQWAADNGAWSDYQAGAPFNADRFARFLDWAACQEQRPDFIVLPDIVLGGAASLDMSLRSLEQLRRQSPWRDQLLLLAVQDGMESGAALATIEQIVGPSLGLFVGGGTPWKEATASHWAKLAVERGSYVHVGRVNTARRIAICAAAGVDSFDGLSPSRFAVTLPPLDAARRQLDLEGFLARAA